ncbi:MAG: hypothetical protein KHY44_05925 [Clostridiales bacterium]|nr:hypothetical protein [Clostridiales bacterium]
MKVRIELNQGKDIYVCNKITGFLFRTALRLKERQESEGISTYLLDDMAQFVCQVFGNRFTVSELYKGLETDEILKVFNNVLRCVINATIAYQKH